MGDEEQMMNRPVVLIFKETLLPLSETFIEAQARHLSQYQPRYAGLGPVQPSLVIPNDAIMLTSEVSQRAAIQQKVYRRVGIARQFHREAGKAKPVLVHAHFASGGRSALPLVRHLKVPLVVTLHGSDVTTRMDFASRYRGLWSEASAFICVSDYIRQRALEAGFPAEKLRTLYTGIDREVFPASSLARQKDLVVFVGRLVEKKGCGFLLRAMAEVQKHHSSARTVVIGDGELRGSLETLASKLGVRCQFLGARPQSIVKEWISKAGVFCAPSVAARNGDSEGLGMVFAEAQAMGTPVASFAHGGIPEVVLHGQTGLLAREGDAQGLAAGIRRLIEDQPFWKSCSEFGIEWVRAQFDIQKQTKQLERLYSEACGLEEAKVLSEGTHQEPLNAAVSHA